MKLNAFISVYNTEKTPELLMFARRLMEQRDWDIVSSGGTATFLEEGHIPVTYVEAITGMKSMFNGRIKTMHPGITAGMITSDEMSPELVQWGYRRFDLAYVTFYPLKKELHRDGATFESCIENLDVGGPTAVAAMCKGGNRIVMVEPAQIAQVTTWLNEGCPNPERFKFDLATRALQVCADYAALAAQIRTLYRPVHLTAH